MSNKREFIESEEDETFMRRVKERRRNRYYIRKREEIERNKTKKDSNCQKIVIIPLDIIVSKVLTRLPVKSLLRFRSVCKYWRDVTYDPWFISLHLEHSKKNPVFLIAPLKRGKQNDISLYKYNIVENINRSMKTANLMFKHEFSETLKVLDTPLHANGLVLLGSPHSLVVCNPCTREFIKLPDGHRNAEINIFDFTWQLTKSRGRAALSYVSSINSYKVVQYFYRHFGYNGGGIYCSVGLEILTLDGNKECLRWEVASEDAPYPIDNACPQAVGDFVYFKINNRFHRTTPKAILSYNLKDEKYRVVDLPCHYMIDFEGINIFDLEGDTCFTYMTNRSVIDIWILSSKDFTLYRKFSIELLRCVCFCVPIAVRNGKLLLHLNDGTQRLDYYNPETGSFENVALIASDMTYYEKENCRLRIFNQESVFIVTSFVESLVPTAGSATN